MHPVDAGAGRRNPLAAGDLRLPAGARGARPLRSEEHTSELQSLMRISYAVLRLKKKKQKYLTKSIYRYYHYNNKQQEYPNLIQKAFALNSHSKVNITM